MVGGIQDLEVESSSDEDEEDEEDEEEAGPQSRKAASTKSSGVFSMFKWVMLTVFVMTLD